MIHDLSKIDFHFLIAASGYEARATHLLKFINPSKFQKKIAFGFSNRKNSQRIENDRIFKEAGFTIIESDGDSGDIASDQLKEMLKSAQESSIRILIDYSSMTRSWYAAIIATMQAITDFKEIVCFFCYSPSVFEPPLATAPNQSVSPISGFGGLDAIDDRPSALVVGLGYEKDRAIGLLEYVDPAACFALITDPPLEKEYVDIVKKNNESFLTLIGSDNQHRHPLSDLQRTSNLLLSLVWGLKDQYRVILAPLGVKPVSLICLLLASRYSDIDVWRVTSGSKAGIQKREALGPILVLEAKFQKFIRLPE